MITLLVIVVAIVVLSGGTYGYRYYYPNGAIVPAQPVVVAP